MDGWGMKREGNEVIRGEGIRDDSEHEEVRDGGRTEEERKEMIGSAVWRLKQEGAEQVKGGVAGPTHVPETWLNNTLEARG